MDQNQTIRNDINSLFANYNKTTVPTGYLLDYAIDVVDLPYYNGTIRLDSNIVDKSLFGDILRSIRSANVRTSNPFAPVSTIMSNFDTGEISDEINIGIAFFKYNQIKSTALEDNLIAYNEYSKKVTYRTGNPYDEHTLLAFAPSSHYCSTGNVTFRFLPSFFLKNRTDLQSISISCGDGSGTRSVTMGSTIQANYNSPGEKMLLLTIRTITGEVYYAQSRLYVFEQPPPIQKAPGKTPDVTIHNKGVTTEHSFVNVRAQVTPYYADGHTSITKPFIIVEGFDPWELKGIVNDGTGSDSLAVELGFTHHAQFYNDNYKHFDNYFRDYDIVYIDLFDGTEDITTNALLLTDIINAINQEKANSGSIEKNIIMGQSMGGLVARYALCLMEEYGMPHETSVYISHDSPHHGANLPLSASSLLHKLMSFLAGESMGVMVTDAIMNDVDIAQNIRDIYKVLHSPAVKQMVYNYVGKDGNVDNAIHEAWQEILDNAGFPQGDENYPIKNLCIVNGRQANYSWFNNRYFLFLNSYVKTSILSDIFMYVLGCTYIPQFLADIINLDSLIYSFSILGTSRYDLKARALVHNSSSTDTLAHLSLKYTKKYLWREKYTYDIFNSTTYQANLGGMAYDRFPSSNYTLTTETFPSNGIVIEDENYLGKYRLRYGMANNFGFIPVASALCIIPTSEEMTSSEYNRDYFITPPIPHEETPFDAYFLPASTETHIELSQNIFEWLRTQINFKINGNILGKTGTPYSVAGLLGVTQWSTSDASIATINPIGVLNVKKTGNVDVIARIYNNGRSYYAKKRIITGFPEMYLKYRYLPEMGYIVNALPVLEENDALVDSLVNSGGLRYEWGIKTGEGNIEWTTSDSRTFPVGIPESSVNTTVYMKLRNGEDFGTVYSVTFRQELPFTANYSHAVVNNSQSIYFVKPSGAFDPISSVADFATTYNYVALYPEDNANASPTLKLKGNNCYLNIPGTSTYLTGVKQGLNWKWAFTFFDSPYFLNNLDWILRGAGGSNSFHKDCNIIVCNSEQEKMQLIPFQIIYNPIFGN